MRILTDPDVLALLADARRMIEAKSAAAPDIASYDAATELLAHAVGTEVIRGQVMLAHRLADQRKA